MKKRVFYAIITISIIFLIVIIYSFNLAERQVKEAPRNEDWNPGYPRTAIQLQGHSVSNDVLNIVKKADIFVPSYQMDASKLQFAKNLNQNLKIIPFHNFCGIYFPLGTNPGDPNQGVDYSRCNSDPVFREKWFYHCEMYNFVEKTYKGT